MKLACSTVVFRKETLEKALSTIKEIGYEYIETQAIHPWCPHVDIDNDDPIEYATHITNFGFKGTTGIWMPHGNLIADEQSVEYGIRTIEWADAAGIPVVITGDGMKPKGIDDESAFGILEERLSKMLQYARTLQVKVAIEPHGTFSLSSNGLKRLMTISDEPWLGINYDAANIFRAGYVESKEESFGWAVEEKKEDEVSVLSSISDRVVYFHAKDLQQSACTALGDGEVRVSECIKILDSLGYKGTYSLETEGNESFEDSVIIASKSLEFLKKELAKNEITR
ncbi:MAG: sugar phosphate isomerase/epimerase [Clostridia bacterium]|nr:sugar phosphate isomerase/epimerase [Clostridia bacterium]